MGSQISARDRRNFPLFQAFFAVYTGAAVLWLLAGLAAALGQAIPALHETYHEWGRGTGLVSELARNAANASHGSDTGGRVLLDYLFSSLNLGLGLFLVWLRPSDRAARLLGLGMVGTAVAFNLQGHNAFAVVPYSAILGAAIYHDIAVHVVSGISYLFALLLFPDGRLVRGASKWLGRIFAVLAALFAAVVGFGTAWTDHGVGLVVAFGLLIPIAGVTAQVARHRRPATPEERQQSRLLVWALALAFTAAAVVGGMTFLLPSADDALAQTTRRYEFTSPAPGTYFFRCDPHPDDMTGTIRFVAGKTLPRVVDITASDLEFDKRRLTLPANEDVFIRFTNEDADPHNVAIYRNRGGQPLFIGEVFSGKSVAGLAFRGFAIVFTLIPIALFAGILRFRLWDIDKVIHKTFLYAALAAFIGVVYIAVVVGVGAVLGGAAGSLPLSIIATAIVAVAFEPVRARLQRVANRLVYGERATPYEVLSHFSDRVAGVYSGEDILPRMAQILAEGTGARRADVWLVLGSELVRAASSPTDGKGRERLQLQDGHLPRLDAVDRAVPVRHQDELLGALTVTKGPGEQLSPVEDNLLADLASQAGLVLRNVRLTAELEARLEQISAQAEELRISRQRIVAAQDKERRRLERNIHDGAQQHLVALAVKLRLAKTLAGRDPRRAREVISQLRRQTEEALDTLRDLSRGIYPPLLSEHGLLWALEAQAAKSPIPMEIHGDGISRYSLESEAVVYFTCLEALQNAAKYSRASSVRLHLKQLGDELYFSVRDDGVGFDPDSVSRGAGLGNMADRVEAAGGRLEVHSEPGRGTAVTGYVPVRIAERVA